MRLDKNKAGRRRLGSGAKWMCTLLIVLAAAGITEYLRMEMSVNHVSVTAPFQPQYSNNEKPESSIALAADICGLTAFRERYGTSGAGQKIALIDSGIDLSHPDFAMNSDGTAKVAVFYDYTDEGLLSAEPVVQEGRYLSAGGMLYDIGGIYNSADKFYMAFLDMDLLRPQLLNSVEGKFAMLVTAVDGQYDCVYLDTDQDGSFIDERPLRCYQESGDYLTLQYGTNPLNIVISSISPDGQYVHVSADTLGHGTFLSGILAANGDVYHGLAPNAQLYIYKIFDSSGASSQQKLANAIEQAVQDDVDCINLSLSIPKEEPISPLLAKALQAARKSDIPVIAAAGNYGPGKDTLAYPARDSSVIAVGSYAHPEQYFLDKAVLLEQRVITDYSGRGSINGKAAPFLVAPSGAISTVPCWYKEQYLYDYGTSISAAMVTAAVCHLQEYAKQGVLEGISHFSVAQIQSLLAGWAQDLSYPACEQGYGAFCMGQFPNRMNDVALRSLQNPQPIAYALQDTAALSGNAKDSKKELMWSFSVPQGVSQSWHIIVPEDMHMMEFTLLLDTEQPDVPFESPIAMGRCRMYVYNPDGELTDVTEYIGASYGRELQTGTKVSVWHPKSGNWEIVVTSADNLSLYNHFVSTGLICVEGY